MSGITLSRRICGWSAGKDGSHNKKRAGVTVSTRLNPLPEKSCEMDTRELRRTVIHTVDVIQVVLVGGLRVVEPSIGWRDCAATERLQV